MPETYAKTFRESVLSKLRYGKIERYEYAGRTLNNTATELFIEGKTGQRLFIPFNTTVHVDLFGAMKDTTAGTNVQDTFAGRFRVHRAASGSVIITTATIPFTKQDGTTAFTALALSVSNAEEVRLTYTGTATSGLNLIRLRMNVVSVCSDSDVVVS